MDKEVKHGLGCLLEALALAIIIAALSIPWGNLFHG
jgi:hypothetical protein